MGNLAAHSAVEGAARVVREGSAEASGASDIGSIGAAREFMIQGDPDTIANYRNYQQMIARAVDVFGDEIKASQWLSTPSADFEGRTPLEAAEDAGYNPAILEPIFVVIEHGIY